MEEFKFFKRKEIAELREITEEDIQDYSLTGCILGDSKFRVSISDADKSNGSPKLGDMIARNPKDFSDMWLVAKEYFHNNFEPI